MENATKSEMFWAHRPHGQPRLYSTTLFQMTKNNSKIGAGESSAVKKTNCASRDPGSIPHTHNGDSQPSIPPIPGALCPLLPSADTGHTWCTDIAIAKHPYR